MGPAHQTLHSNKYACHVLLIVINLPVFVSSTNFICTDFLFASKSLMKTLNSIGPKTDPCRIPLETHPFVDNHWLITAFWDLSVIQFLIHLTCTPSYCIVFIFYLNVSPTKSNASEKSKSFASASFPWSTKHVLSLKDEIGFIWQNLFSINHGMDCHYLYSLTFFLTNPIPGFFPFFPHLLKDLQ